MTARKIGIDRNGKPVLPNTRLPDEHYQPGDTAEVVFEGAVGTIRPQGFKRPEPVCPYCLDTDDINGFSCSPACGRRGASAEGKDVADG